MFFYYTGGGGVGEAGGSARVVKKPHWFVKEKLFQRACRIILGPQKHVLHLVWISFVINILYIIFRVNSSLLVLMDLIWFYDIRGDKLYNGVETQFVMISRQFKFWSRKLVSLSYFSPKSKNFFQPKKSFDSILWTSLGKALMRLPFSLGCEQSKAMKMLWYLSTHKRWSGAMNDKKYGQKSNMSQIWQIYLCKNIGRLG